MLRTGCPHRLCLSCTDPGAGTLDDCPVCKAALPLPDDREEDKEFARHMRKVVLKCGCDMSVPILEAESHVCDHILRKRKRPEEASPHLQGRKAPPVGPNRQTFACPFCAESNQTREALLKHVEDAHSSLANRCCVCPICVVMPWGNTRQKTTDFLRHLQRHHRYDVWQVVDFNMDEESMLEKATRESMKSAGKEEELDLYDKEFEEVLALSAREAGMSSSSTTDPLDVGDMGDGSSDSSSTSGSGTEDADGHAAGPTASSSSSQASCGRGVEQQGEQVEIMFR